MKIVPFKFQPVHSFSRQHVQLMNTLCRVLPGVFVDRLQTELAKLLKKYVEEDIVFNLKSIQHQQLTKYKKNISDKVVIALIRLYPSEEKIILEIDNELAGLIVNRLLGRRYSDVNRLYPLSDIEIGVLEYILLKILDIVQQFWQNVNLRLGSVFTGKNKLEFVDRYAMVIHLQMNTCNINGFIRVCIPYMVFNDISVNMMPEGKRYVIDRVGFVNVLICAEIGVVEIPWQERMELNTTDILLLDKHRVILSDNCISGDVILRFEHSQNGGISGSIEKDDIDKLYIKIGDYVPGSPVEMEVVMNNKESNTHGTDILENIPISIVVEIGRLRMSVKDIAKLQQGQILELKKNPDEPVNLVVDNKVIGTGELVDIEGQLGVRILQLQGHGN